MKVSICIPAYKQPELLRKALESILIQDFKDFEIVVTDDSPDFFVKDVCDEYIAKNIAIRYVKNVERRGTPENWNEAMRHAKGEYIKILHHDDWFSEKDSLSKLVKILDANPDANFAFCGCRNFNPHGDLQNIHRAKWLQIQKLKKDPTFLFAGNFVGAPSTTIFRNGLEIYFDTQFKWVVDIDFYIRIIAINGIFEYTEEPLISIRMLSSDQVTASCENDKDIQISEYFNLYEKIQSKTELMSPHVFGYLWYLFEKFDVKSIDDLESCGIKNKIPVELTTALLFHKSRIFIIPVLIIDRLSRFFILSYKFLIIGCAYFYAILRKLISGKNN